MNKRDCYEVLGVDKKSSQAEIKKAFKMLAKKYHPDISKEHNAEEMFTEIQDAYAILSDSDKRAQYDQYGHAAFDQMSGGGHHYSDGFDFSDIFSDIFGGGGFGGFGGQQRQSHNGPRDGRDMEMQFSLSFKEAVFGCTKDISLKVERDCNTCSGTGAKSKNDVKTCSTCAGHGRVRRQQQSIFGMTMTEAVCPDCRGKGQQIKNPCSDCRGTGRIESNQTFSVNFPAGVDTGAYMRLKSKGEGGTKGGRDGDLFLNISVATDNFFVRNGNDLTTNIPITYTQAVLGSTLSVPTVHGDVELKIPAGTQTGSKLRLKGMGVHPKQGHKGDQMVVVNIKVPTKISKEEKKILETLRHSEGDHSDQFNFFDNIKKIFNK